MMCAGHTHSESLRLDSVVLSVCRFTLKQSKVESVQSDKLKGYKVAGLVFQARTHDVTDF